MPTIAFTGGGTGGHIYPGLAVAEVLREKAGDCRPFWIGSNRGMDRSIVEAAGIEFVGIPAGKLRRYFTLKTIPDAFWVLSGFFAARRILKERKVDLLFSKGGFVSVPPCAAAASLGIPVLTHESDFSPGLATRINLRFVRKTSGLAFTAYRETRLPLPADRVRLAGNPVRRAFRGANAEAGRRFLGLGPQSRILLVLGGSQGAKEINDLVRDSLAVLLEHYTVVHQYGPGLSAPEAAAAPSGNRYIPLAYIGSEMPDVLAAAELVLGRSGAGTLWEAATLGKPLLLIPLCGAGTRGDQVENARHFARLGAAEVLQGGDATAENLLALVGKLAGDCELRERMARAAERIGSLDGSAIIGDSIVETLCSLKGRNQ